MIQRLKTILRTIARQLYIWVDPLNAAIYRLAHPNTGPIPPAVNRMRVGSRAIGRFMDAGRNCYLPIKNAIDRYHGEKRAGTRVLDFGCGVGRVLQYFCGHGYELFACDVDHTAISYIARAYPQVQASVSRYLPPLAYSSDYFDIIYSVSIWTHLPEDLQEPWLFEMKRILKPGGIALLTTIGPYGYRKGTHLKGVTFSLAELMETGFHYSKYQHRHGLPNVSPSFGIAYHTPEYVQRAWSKVFDVLDVQEGVIDDLNELVVLRKA